MSVAEKLSKEGTESRSHQGVKPLPLKARDRSQLLQRRNALRTIDKKEEKAQTGEKKWSPWGGEKKNATKDMTVKAGKKYFVPRNGLTRTRYLPNSVRN